MTSKKTKKDEKSQRELKSLREIKKNYKPSDISSKEDSEEIRKYFIDRMILMIEYMSAKVFSGNVRNKDAENVRINQAKTIINACNVGNRILKDFEYDKILKEVNELKSAILYEGEDGQIIEIHSDNVIDELDSKIEKLEANERSE